MSTAAFRDEVIELVITGKWRPGQMHEKLATKWNLRPREVHDIVQDAMRAVRLSDAGTKQAYIASKLAELDELVETARAMKKTHVTKDGDVIETPAPDVRSAVMAIRTQLETVGGLELGKLAAKRASSIEVPDGSEYESLTPQQRIEAHEKAIGEERAKLQETH